MAKFHGMVGYMQTLETAPGAHTTEITEKPCKGDILRNSQTFVPGDHLNDNIVINNRFSIVADAFWEANIANIRYILWNGVKWKVESIDIQHPRLILHIGGVYNG